LRASTKLKENKAEKPTLATFKTYSKIIEHHDHVALMRKETTAKLMYIFCFICRAALHTAR
jgi:hypothetical protein